MPLKISGQQLRELYHDFPIAICLIDRDTRLIGANHAFARQVGVPREVLPGRSIGDIFAPHIVDKVRSDFARFDAGEDVPNHEALLLDGVYLVSVLPVRTGSDGCITSICVSLTDITELKRLEANLEQVNRSLRDANDELNEVNRKLERAAKIDSLTGLPNRRALDDYLPRAITRCRHEKQPLSMLMVDVDYFKRYNDYYGHMSGDNALSAIAGAIADVLRLPCDFAARFGGEEFAVILPATDVDNAVTVAARLHDALEKIAIDHRSSPFGRITVSIGLSCLPTLARIPSDANVRTRLFLAADQAVYAAKEEGRNRTSIAPAL